jgi:hypothetical protein
MTGGSVNSKKDIDSAFEKAKERIPAFLRNRVGARFTAIYNSQKNPAEGVSARWAESGGKNYGINDPTLLGFLKSGHNYGTVNLRRRTPQQAASYLIK